MELYFVKLLVRALTLMGSPSVAGIGSNVENTEPCLPHHSQASPTLEMSRGTLPVPLLALPIRNPFFISLSTPFNIAPSSALLVKYPSATLHQNMTGLITPVITWYHSGPSPSLFPD